MNRALRKKILSLKYASCLGIVMLYTLLTTVAQAQSNVTGRVISGEDGTGLPGVNILVKGTSAGTISDATGNFSIAVNAADGVLVFSFVGYETQEVVLSGRTSLDITLTSDARQLKEVVVTALGIEKDKSKVGYAVQEVKGSDLVKARDPNPISNLTGKVAGLTVASSPELLGSPGLFLRGRRPLFVVDGVPIQSDTWNISADDIESYTVLKGPAASALYGSRGQNGAIQITTKKGSNDARGFSVDVNSSVMIERGFLAIPKVQDEYGPGDHGRYAFADGKGAGINDSDYDVWGPKFEGQLIPQYDGVYDPNNDYVTTWPSGGTPFTGNIVPTPWVARGKDNLKRFIRDGVINTNNVAVAASGSNYDLRFSTSYNYQRGLVPNTQLNTNNFNIAAGIDLSPKVRFEANVNYNKQYTDNFPDVNYGPNSLIYNMVIWGGADWDVDDMKKLYQDHKEGTQQMYADYTRYNNPWFMAEKWLRGHYKTDIYGYMSLRLEITPTLNVVGRTQINTYDIFRDERFPYSATTYGREQAKGDYREDKRNLFENNTDVMLNYHRDLSTDLSIKASLGGNLRSYKYQSSYVTTDYLNVPGLYNFTNSLNPIKSYNYEAPMSVLSAYGYVDLSFRDYLTLSLTGRTDKNSTLPQGQNQFFYPSASLSAVISEMTKLPEAISFLKLRGSYARVGGALTAPQIGPIPNPPTSLVDNPLGYGSTYLSPYDGPNFVNSPVYDIALRWNGTPAASYTNTITNKEIEPSFSSAWETGMDVRFLSNRLGLDVTYYESGDGPEIYRLKVSEASGYFDKLVNGVKTTRKGWEVVLNATPVTTASGFRWDVALNWSRYREYLDEIYGNIKDLTPYIQVGERVDQFWGTGLVRKADGTPVIGADGRAIPETSINGNARSFMGYTNPDWTYGIINTIRYKSVSLSFQFDGRVGGVIEDYIQKQTFRGGRHIATVQGEFGDARYQDYLGVKSFVGEGVNLTGGAIQLDNEGNITNESELSFNSGNATATYLQDWISRYYNTNETNIISRTFSKLREVIVTYNVPTKTLSNTFIKSASVSLIGRNLLYFAEKKDMDIEQYGGSDGAGGLQTPTTRRFGVNVNLTF
jgi:TonB-linked SusC/RagA family outer membrane protein